ncbi:DUF998 domain-containing protein [Actinomadura vinacea]|uniref:DUF998 domain-containing protein n=1 Tax=Actinomadura vinacea TaxID=115336 RepID=A0ABN3I9V9_9ACTN
MTTRPTRATYQRSAASPSDRVTRRLLACGAIGPPLFLSVIIIEGALRPHYDPVEQMSSALSLSDRGWIQITNFVVTGLSMIAFAVGLRRALPSGRACIAGPLMFSIFGAALIGAGVFVGDPSDGYPPGSPSSPDAATTWHGTMHNAVSTGVFLSLAVACFVFARRYAAKPGQRVWALYCAATGVALPVLQPLLNVLTPGTETGKGLIQKVTIAVGWGWITLLATRLLRRHPEPTQHHLDQDQAPFIA